MSRWATCSRAIKICAERVARKEEIMHGNSRVKFEVYQKFASFIEFQPTKHPDPISSIPREYFRKFAAGGGAASIMAN